MNQVRPMARVFRMPSPGRPPWCWGVQMIAQDNEGFGSAIQCSGRARTKQEAAQAVHKASAAVRTAWSALTDNPGA